MTVIYPRKPVSLEQVRALDAQGFSQRAIADMVGRSQATIGVMLNPELAKKRNTRRPRAPVIGNPRTCPMAAARRHGLGRG